MPTYSYQAIDINGKSHRGKAKAASESTLKSELWNSKKWRLTHSNEAASKSKSAANLTNINLFKPKVKLKDMTVFSRMFATMMSAGLGITTCLSILTEQSENPTLAEAIAEVKADVEGGNTLNDALAKHPKIFPDIYINMIKAGESSGALEIVLEQLAEFMEKRKRLKEKVKSALFLPAMILGFSITLTIVLIIFVVPMFEKLYSEAGATLPGATTMLINISQQVRSLRGLIIAAVVALAIFGLKQVINTEKGRLVWDGLKLKAPVFKLLTVNNIVAQFARTLTLLLKGGVPILEAITIVSETIGNKVVSNAMLKVRTSLNEGEGISKPLSGTQIFPPMVTQMVAAGEEAGSLEIMLTKLSDFYEEEVERTAEQLTNMIEPVMIIFIGLIVAGIVGCLYLPIFSLAEKIGGG